MFSIKADLFFQEPGVQPSIPGQLGILYLLRRDALQCLGVDPNTSMPTMPKAIWPGTMTVLAGVDLLGKFHAGNDNSGEVGQRFQNFVRSYFPQLNQGDETAIYQLRNALLHSFGLYSTFKSEIFRFTVTCDRRQLVTRVDNENVLVDLATLHDEFEQAVRNYQCELDKSPALQSNFTNMFPKYGFTHIG